MTTAAMRRACTAAALALVLAACERPTAPDLVQTIDSVEREFLSGSPWRTSVLRSSFAGDAAIAELFSAGRDVGMEVIVDGKARSFMGFVFERKVVRLDGSDGYSCPLVRRTFMGIEGGVTGIVVTGSDFGKSVGPPGGCDPLGGPLVPVRPVVMVVDQSNKRSNGIGGTARVDGSEGETHACDFLKAHADPGFRVDCELRDFVVAANVTLNDGTLAIPRQTLPGVSLTVYCEMNTPIGGCEPMPRR